jgi:hypothetical protein
MATSNSYDWTSTRNEIISAAFRKIGAMSDLETATDPAFAGRLAAGIAALNPMIKAFMAHGMLVWCDEGIAVNMSEWAVQATITLSDVIGYKPLKIIGVLRRDLSSGTDVPMRIETRGDFFDIPNKEQTGTPLAIHYRPHAYINNVTIWPIPDSYWQTNGQVVFRAQRPLQDFDSATDEPDFPVEWHEALIYNLAVRLAPEYGLAGMDRQTLKQEAKEALDLALSFDQEEGSLYIRPAYRWE